MNRVYRIRFNKSSYELDKDYERFSEQEKLAISSMNPDCFFDFNDLGGSYTIYLVFSPIDLKKYVGILDGNLIRYDISDLSEDIMSGGLCIEEEALSYVNALNRFRWNSYKKKIEEWIYQRLDMDFVLDRISQCGGVHKLRPVEQKFLRNFHGE